MTTGRKTAALITGAKVQPYVDIRPDIQHMVEFCEREGFRTEVLVNSSDLFDEEERHSAHIAAPTTTNNTTRSLYYTKYEFRRAFVDFLATSSEQFLIFYYCGHGTRTGWWNPILTTTEYLCLEHRRRDWYADYQLTEDIDRYLPEGKTLYMIVDACHSGGLLNMWKLDSRLDKSVVLFSGANSDIPSWDDQRRGHTGGLFTNCFLKCARVGAEVWKIADDILVEMFRPNQKRSLSPAFRYSRPSMAANRFCQAPHQRLPSQATA